jgi:hypothetical protein
VFSPADYELAARLTGLPIPKTVAEQAAAAPLVSDIIRNFNRAPSPMPGFDDQRGVNTAATRSLNAMPNVSQPEAKNQLERRLQAGVLDPDMMAEVADLVEMISEDPSSIEEVLDILMALREDSMASGDALSAQRPMTHDMPNFGGQYSVLNAPSSSVIPPSVKYQNLG